MKLLLCCTNKVKIMHYFSVSFIVNAVTYHKLLTHNTLVVTNCYTSDCFSNLPMVINFSFLVNYVPKPHIQFTLFQKMFYRIHVSRPWYYDFLLHTLQIHFYFNSICIVFLSLLIQEVTFSFIHSIHADITLFSFSYPLTHFYSHKYFILYKVPSYVDKRTLYFYTQTLQFTLTRLNCQV